MERVRTKAIYVLLATAVLGAIVMPIAFAGAESGPQATASGSVKKQIKKLKQQVNQLQQQVDDVSKQAGPQGPGGPQGAAGPQGPQGPATGPAGGDLTGTYPNPLIGPDAVGSAEIANNAVVEGKIAPSSVGANELGFNSVGSEELQNGSVGADALKDTYAAVSGGASPAADTYVDQVASCNFGDKLLGGGYAWQNDAETISTVNSTPDSLTNPDQWVVRSSSSAAGNTLFAWATCLPR